MMVENYKIFSIEVCVTKVGFVWSSWLIFVILNWDGYYLSHYLYFESPISKASSCQSESLYGDSHYTTPGGTLLSVVPRGVAQAASLTPHNLSFPHDHAMFIFMSIVPGMQLVAVVFW